MGANTNTFRNTEMLNWMGFFSEKMDVSPEKIHPMNLCGKKKNVIPLIESHKRVLIFADESHKELCYELWEAGLGECKVYIGTGFAPGSEITATDIKSVMGRELEGPTVLFVVNENTRESYRIGIKNENFSRGPIRYVGNEIRAVIMSLLDVDRQDTICIVSGESIVIEAAIAASEGTIIAVEPDAGSMHAMEENAAKFGVHNVEIVDGLSKEAMEGLPVPRLSFVVADKHLEDNIKILLEKNEHMQFVIYTLELDTLASIKPLFEQYGIGNMEVMQISVSKTNHNSVFVTQPSPWLITGEA